MLVPPIERFDFSVPLFLLPRSVPAGLLHEGVNMCTNGLDRPDTAPKEGRGRREVAAFYGPSDAVRVECT